MDNFVRNVMFSGILMVHVQALAANQIQTLVDQALLNGASEVVIPAGTYEVSDTLRLNNIDNFSVLADGVTMVLTQRRQTIKVDNCFNLLIQGLTIDIDPLPFTQATITSNAPDWSWLEAQIHEGYPQDPSSSTKVEVYDGDTGLLLPNVWTVYNASVQKLTADTVRVSGTSGYASGVKIGDKIVIGCPQIVPHAVMTRDSISCTYTNVTLHASTTFGFFETGCHGNQYLGVQIIPGPSPVPGGEPRLRSLNADGIHSSAATKGPRIENCTIMCNGDDGIAIRCDFDLILEASGNTVIIVSKGDPEMQAGDTVRSYTEGGVLNFEAVVNAITPVSGYSQLRADVLAGSGVSNTSLFQDMYELTLSTNVSAGAGSWIYPVDRVGNGFIARNNYIFNKRARGLLIKAGDGLIEGNTIEYNHMGAIVLGPEVYWGIAGFSQSVRIINNTINHCGLNPGNAGTIQAGVITVSADGSGGFAPVGGHRDIEISGNRIDQCLGANILATSIDGLIIKNNVLMNTHVEVRNHGQNKGVNPNAGVVIINCSDVTLDENTMYEFGGNTFLQNVNVTSMTGENTFSSEPQSFMNYRLLYQVGSADEDDDEDHMPNLYEFFLGRNPTVVDTVDSLSGIMVDASNATFSVVSPPGGRKGVWVEVQRATTLEPADWTPIATRGGTNAWVSSATLSTQSHSTDPDLEQVGVSEPIGETSSSAFYRLSLSATPPLLDPITYSASADFSGVQGSNSWYYQEYDGSTYDDLIWDSTNGWWQGSEFYLRVYEGEIQPAGNKEAVRKWIAPAGGLINISGLVNRKYSGGDGVTVDIWHNSQQLFSADLLPLETADASVSGVSVAAGDEIRFTINQLGNQNSDRTDWDPTIEFSSYDN